MTTEQASSSSLTDTGLWKLAVYISGSFLAAYLKHTSDPSVPVRVIFEQHRHGSRESLLSDIENAVYDHPAVLDDYAAEIIIETPRQLWVPDMIARQEDAAEKMFCDVYPGTAAQDVMTHFTSGCACLHTLTGGLTAFLQRTFPGARISCHAGILVSRFIAEGEGQRLIADIRRGETDIIVLDGRRLLLAATHPTPEPADALFHIVNIMQAAGLDPAETNVSLSGDEDARREIMPVLRKYVANVTPLATDTLTATQGMPLAATLSLSKATPDKSHQ